MALAGRLLRIFKALLTTQAMSHLGKHAGHAGAGQPAVNRRPPPSARDFAGIAAAGNAAGDASLLFLGRHLPGFSPAAARFARAESST